MEQIIKEMNREQVELVISTTEEQIKEINATADAMREIGVEEGYIRGFLPDPKIYTVLEMLDDRLKELKEKENATSGD